MPSAPESARPGRRAPAPGPRAQRDRRRRHLLRARLGRGERPGARRGGRLRAHRPGAAPGGAHLRDPRPPLRRGRRARRLRPRRLRRPRVVPRGLGGLRERSLQHRRGGGGPDARDAARPRPRRRPRRARGPGAPRDAPRGRGGLRPAPLRPRLDEPHRPQAPAARAAGRRLRPRLGALPRPGGRGAGFRLASRRPHRRLRLPGLRDRAGDRRPGPLLVPRRPVRHRGLARPRHRPVRGPRPGVRHRAARARVVHGAPRGNGRGGLGNRPRVARRRGHQRLGPRHLLRDDGHDAPLPVRPLLGRPVALRPGDGVAERRADAGRRRSPGWSSPRS